MPHTPCTAQLSAPRRRRPSLGVAATLLTLTGGLFGGCDEQQDVQAVAVTAAATPTTSAKPADPSVAKAVAQAAAAAHPSARPAHAGEAPPLPPGHGNTLPPGHPPVAGIAGTQQVDARGPKAGQPKLPAGKQGPRGKVAEVLQAGRYTYLRIGKDWSAVPAANVKVGQDVAVMGAMKMENFKSKATGRTFPEVWFGHLALPADQVAKGAAGAAAGVKKPPAKIGAKVQRATGQGALTVAELHGQKATLQGKTVRIRGKVVKFNAGILDRNWLHLQDGSGDPDAGSHDITVTTPTSAAAVKPGAVVTVEGVVALDRDFGSGYRYGVLVEKAKVTP